MATLAMRSRFLLAGVTALTLAALCAIGVATLQVADIKTDVSRILASHPDALTSGSADTALCDQDGQVAARPVKDWKWIVRYANPPRIKHADTQAVAAKLAALHRNMLLTFALVAAAAGLLVLLAWHTARAITELLVGLKADLQNISNLAAPAATTREAAPGTAGHVSLLDQALHAAWEQSPATADPAVEDRNVQPGQTPQNLPATQPRKPPRKDDQ